MSFALACASPKDEVDDGHTSGSIASGDGSSASAGSGSSGTMSATASADTTQGTDASTGGSSSTGDLTDTGSSGQVDDSGNSTGDDDELVAITEVFDVRGGQLELSDGARLKIPEGALAQATSITLRREDCNGIMRSSAFPGCLYRVLGDPSVLKGRLELTLSRQFGVAVGKVPCLAHASAEGWRCVFDSAFDGGSESVTASIGVFGAYAPHAEVERAPDGRVTDLEFTACGGDVLGEWTMVASSGSFKQLTGMSWTGGTNPYDDCDHLDYDRDYPFSVSGTLAFIEGAVDPDSLLDGTLRDSSSFLAKKRELITDTCLDLVGATCLDGCVHADGLCSCVWHKAQGGGGGESNWAYGSEYTLLMHDTVKVPYCVIGNVLTMLYDHEDGPYFVVYVR